MTDAPFARATRLSQAGDRAWTAEVDETWLQGRAIYGGLQSALAVRCLRAVVGDDRPLRTLHVHFCGATAAGTLRVEVEPVREGRRVSCVGARLLQGDEVVAAISATFAAAREHWLAMPGPGRPDLGTPTPMQIPMAPGIPAFTQHLDVDLRGPVPYAGASEARSAGWVRFREASPVDEALVVALADSWAPAAVAMMPTPRPAASVDMTLQLCGPPRLEAQDPAGFFAYDAVSTSAFGGYAEETGAMWLPDGSLGVRVRQLRAVY